MNRLFLIILQVVGGVYILIVGLAILGLLIATVKTWLQIAFNALRKCARRNRKGGKFSAQTTRRNP